MQATEMTDISPEGKDRGEAAAGGGFQTSSEVAERLRDAVRGAGGARLVAALSGVKSRTLTRYLSGSQMKHAAAVALAQVTRVRLEWLLTGVGPRHITPGVADGAAPAPAESGASPPLVRAISAISAEARAHEGAVSGAPSIWRTVDFEALVLCLELQEGLDRLGGGEVKSVRSRLRRAFNAYDLRMTDRED